MSTPFRYCTLVQAADDPAVFARIHQAMYANLKGGHWTLHPCRCEPLCRELSLEEQQSLQSRFLQRPAGLSDAEHAELTTDFLGAE